MWYEPSAWAEAVNSVMITYYILNTIQPMLVILFIVGLFGVGWYVLRQFAIKHWS